MRISLCHLSPVPAQDIKAAPKTLRYLVLKALKSPEPSKAQSPQTPKAKARMFSMLPTDVARVISTAAISMRNEDRIEQVLGTFTTAFTLPKTETDADYHVPVFADAKDTARISLVYDGEFAKVGAHRYSVFIDIATGNGTEEYRMFLNEYDDGGAPEVSLQVVGTGGPGKYEELVAEAFYNVYPDGLVYGVSE